MSECIVDFQALRGYKKEFIVRELAVVDFKKEREHLWLFKCPDNTLYTLKENSWVVNHLHGIDKAIGEVDYNFLKHIICYYIGQFDIIYAKGYEKCQFLTHFLHRKVIDVEIPSLKSLSWIGGCMLPQHSNGRLSCALGNCKKIKAYKRAVISSYSPRKRFPGN
nr:TPA_asm: MAEL [Ladona dragonfly adintovirus]